MESRCRQSGTILTWRSGLNFPLLGAFVSLLANMCVLYHILREKSNVINKKVQDLIRSRLKNIRELEIRELGILGEPATAGKNVVDPFDTSTKLSAGSAQDKFLLIFGGFCWFFSVFDRKMLDFRCFLQIICAAGGQHEEHSVLRKSREGRSK